MRQRQKYMPEYQLKLKDIIKGISLIAITLFLFRLVIGVLVNGSLIIFGKTIRDAHPLMIVFSIVILVVCVGTLGGFAKAIEAGFSPYRLFDKFKKKRKPGDLG